MLSRASFPGAYTWTAYIERDLISKRFSYIRLALEFIKSTGKRFYLYLCVESNTAFNSKNNRKSNVKSCFPRAHRNLENSTRRKIFKRTCAKNSYFSLDFVTLSLPSLFFPSILLSLFLSLRPLCNGYILFAGQTKKKKGLSVLFNLKLQCWANSAPNKAYIHARFKDMKLSILHRGYKEKQRNNKNKRLSVRISKKSIFCCVLSRRFISMREKHTHGISRHGSRLRGYAVYERERDAFGRHVPRSFSLPRRDGTQLLISASLPIPLDSMLLQSGAPHIHDLSPIYKLSIYPFKEN